MSVQLVSAFSSFQRSALGVELWANGGAAVGREPFCLPRLVKKILFRGKPVQRQSDRVEKMSKI